MVTTVETLLSLPELRRGVPRVVGGAAGLQREVRWAHVSELPDINGLLKGGEVILCTGVALPTTDAGLTGYIERLALAGASAVIVELGRAFHSMPQVLIDAADAAAMPLVSLAEEIRFVQVTEELYSVIVDEQLRQLRDSERIHRLFTDLSTRGASTSEALRHVADLTGRPVVLENLAHQVLSYATIDVQSDQLLADWEKRSRQCEGAHQVTSLQNDSERWLVATVGARGELWGRLIVMFDAEDDPSGRDVAIVERAASMLALNRLVERDRETLELQSHRTLLHKIMRQTYSSSAQVYARAAAMGVPLKDHRLVAAVVLTAAQDAGEDAVSSQRTRRELGERVVVAARAAGIHALVAALSRNAMGALLALPPEVDEDDVLERFASEVHRLMRQISLGEGATIGIGSTVDRVRDVQRSFSEAQQVADAAETSPSDRLYFRLHDIRIRGLVQLLRDDVRLQVFVERELGALLALESQRSGTDLLAALKAYLENGANKSSAAAALGVSRPAMYHRLTQIERVLGVSLESPESCVSLHVALLGLECLRTRRTSQEIETTEAKIGRQFMHDRAVEAG